MDMEIVFLGAAIVLGLIALVQSFRVYDLGQTIEFYRKDVTRAEERNSELRNELRTVEKEHSRMVQMITNFADRLNE